MNLDPDSPAGGLTPFRDRAYSWGKDAAERTIWTLVQSGLAFVTVETADLPYWAAVPIATGLAAVKTWAARRFGKEGTASTAPGV